MKNGFAQGVRATMPVSASVAAYGSVLGVLAVHKGMAWGTLLLMNGLVFAGSSQFVMVEMWNESMPFVEMGLAVLVINLRYLLAGASLEPILRNTPLLRRLFIIHFATDESWAVTMAADRLGKATPAYLLGAGLCVFGAWSLGTMAGTLCGSTVSNPERFALDFAFTAVFTALAISIWRGKDDDMLPWAVALVVSLLAARFLPGKWYIVIGALCGALMTLLSPVPEKEEKAKAVPAQDVGVCHADD